MPRSNFWNYTDAIAYALAQIATEDTEKFPADPTYWHQALYDLREEWRHKVPKVYNRISFDEREDYMPYSADIDHFLHVMAQSDLMSTGNPAFEVLSFDSESKEAIINLNKNRVTDEEKAALSEFGGALSRRLKQHLSQ